MTLVRTVCKHLCHCTPQSRLLSEVAWARGGWSQRSCRPGVWSIRRRAGIVQGKDGGLEGPRSRLRKRCGGVRWQVASFLAIQATSDRDHFIVRPLLGCRLLGCMTLRRQRIAGVWLGDNGGSSNGLLWRRIAFSLHPFGPHNIAGSHGIRKPLSMSCCLSAGCCTLRTCKACRVLDSRVITPWVEALRPYLC